MTETEEDEEYDNMMKAERKAKRELKANHYKDQNFKCCETCKHHCRDYPESSIECLKLFGSDTWSWSLIDEHGICDFYEAI